MRCYMDTLATSNIPRLKFLLVAYLNVCNPCQGHLNDAADFFFFSKAVLCARILLTSKKSRTEKQ